MEVMIGYVAVQIPENEKLAVLGHSLGGSLAIYGVAKTEYSDRIKLLMTVYHCLQQIQGGYYMAIYNPHQNLKLAKMEY